MAGYHRGDNAVKIVSPKGSKGTVKYGESVSLLGKNGKYLLSRYSGKITSRATVIAKDSEWKINGGSGAVRIGDRVSFKNEFGYLTADEDGANSLAREITAMQKFVI